MFQHPIPQNITTYQFHLIGDMTLKQFFILLTGIGVAVLTYNTNLFTPIKLGIIVLSVIIGFVGAFMPIEERPLDQWFVAFIKAIYRPTHFLWHKNPKVPAYFTYVVSPNKIQPPDAPDLAAQAIARKREGLKSFLQTLPEHHQINQLEHQEQSSLTAISDLFTNPNPPPLPTANPSISLASPHPQAPVFSPLVRDIKPHEPPSAPAKSIDVIPSTPVPIREGNLSQTLYESPLAPQSPAVRDGVGIVSPNGPVDQSGPVDRTPQPITNVTIPRGPVTPAQPAATDKNLPFPSAPTTPNTVVGMVLDQSGKIIDNVIVEIQDDNGIPVRATKTNRLGQFFSTTPLKNGHYRIMAEKNGFAFTPFQLNASGAVIPPLRIQATA